MKVITAILCIFFTMVINAGTVEYKLSLTGEPIVFDECNLAWAYMTDNAWEIPQASVYCSTGPVVPITSNPHRRILYINDVPVRCYLTRFSIQTNQFFDIKMNCFEWDIIFVGDFEDVNYAQVH